MLRLLLCTAVNDYVNLISPRCNPQNMFSLILEFFITNAVHKWIQYRVDDNNERRHGIVREL